MVSPHLTANFWASYNGTAERPRDRPAASGHCTPATASAVHFFITQERAKLYYGTLSLILYCYNLHCHQHLVLGREILNFMFPVAVRVSDCSQPSTTYLRAMSTCAPSSAPKTLFTPSHPPDLRSLASTPSSQAPPWSGTFSCLLGP